MPGSKPQTIKKGLPQLEAKKSWVLRGKFNGGDIDKATYGHTHTQGTEGKQWSCETKAG